MAASRHHRTTRRPARARTIGAAVAATLIGVLALTGCSSSAEPMSAPQDQGGGFAGEPGAAPGAPPVADGAAGEDADRGPLAAVQERSLIYTGTITVQVESVVQAADEASAVVIGLGGVVAGDTRSIDEDRSQATLVLRVPTDRFTSTLDRLADLGAEQNRQVQSQDVTEQLVDLDARIATQQASVDRIRALLAQAQTIAEIVSLETELTRRQGELDSLTQRRATMAGLVELATITLVLHGPSGPVEEEEPETGFLAGLRSGWDGFLASVAIVLTVAGWLLPWAIVIGVPALVATWVLRRRRRAARTTTTPPTAE